MRMNLTKRVISAVLTLALLLPAFAVLPITVGAASASAVTDTQTLSSWKEWFSPDSSRYSGGVFLDKSVYTANEALTDEYFSEISGNLSFEQDNFGNDNFMVALSALGSNSEVLGYSYTPTDTVVVLDASTSMGTGAASASAIDDMVAGANDAIKRLLALNNHNRVGVVIYNGTSSVLLPLDRYESTAQSGDILAYQRTTGRNPVNRICVAANVFDGEGVAVGETYVNQAQGTYTQGGFYAAAQQFLGADPVIEDGKIQGGTHRIPIMVLMSDGEPSYRTKTSTHRVSIGATNTTVSLVDRYSEATNANVDNSNFREDEITAFSTMLTAAWAESEISAHYGEDARFYTLGYNLSAGHQYAHNVLDPLNSTNALASRFASFAETYLGLSVGEIGVLEGDATFAVRRSASKIENLDYVDRYWQASGADRLQGAFESIVNEIIIQSRYYSTLVSGTNYTQDGYISFTDEIGTHMQVKDVKGLYIGGDKLVSGGMFAEFVTTGSVGDYDNTAYDTLKLQGFENEVLAAISERFDISLSQARQMIDSAEENGFVYYNGKTDFSNYLPWYADENSRFLGVYTGKSDHAPQGAKYLVRSYFYMGDVTQNHAETSMLYALVRVREDLDTGRQIVDMNLPAALLPMVTYTIRVSGDEMTAENLEELTCEFKNPISLLYEVGLSDELDPYNLAEQMADEAFRKNADGTYSFYTNRWRSDTGTAFVIPEEPNPHIYEHGEMDTAVAHFIPSLENERYYHTENTVVYDASHTPYSSDTAPAGEGYFTDFSWVKKSGEDVTLEVAYNPLSETLLSDESNLFRDAAGVWYVKRGAPEFYFGEDVHGEQAHAHKKYNETETLGWSNYPKVSHHESEGHTGYHVLNYLGNNGRLTVAPAQGLKLQKSVSTPVAGAETAFEFTVTLSQGALAATFPVRYVRADGTVEDAQVRAAGGTFTVTLSAGDTAYIIDLPAGASYTVEEAYSRAYAPTSTGQTGTIPANDLAEVHFVNAPRGYGSLLVEKNVTHPFDTAPRELFEQEFSFRVTFEGAPEALSAIVAPASAVTADGGKTYTFTLKDGHDVLFTNVSEGVQYAVEELDLPAGFTLKTASGDLQGTVEKDVRAEALLVNEYKPEGVTAAIRVQGDKTLSGRDWDAAIDRYQVALQRVQFGGQDLVEIGDPVLADVVKGDGADYVIDLSSVTYTEVGTYNYIVYEVKPDTGSVPDVAYDTSVGIFTVEVEDHGTGKLAITSVVGQQGTATATGNSQDGFVVEKNFVNTYLADTLTFDVQKRVVKAENTAEEIAHHRGGILFGLYAETDADTAVYTALSDADGKAAFTIPVKQSEFASARYFYLKEILPPLHLQVVGMTYDTSVQYVVRIEWAAGESAPQMTFYRYDAQAAGGVGDEITDLDAEPLVFTNVFDEHLRSNALVFSGKKTLNSASLRAGDSFSFALYETDATFSLVGARKLQSAVANTPDGAYAFAPVTFDSEGTKYLVAAEEKGSAGGITYDTTLYHVTVEVSRAQEGEKTVLAARATHIHKVGAGDVQADEFNFDNAYRVNDTQTVNVSGRKTLLGRELLEGEFTFGLFPAGQTEPLYTAKNAADGTFAFPELVFEVADAPSYSGETFTYEIREIVPNGNARGITYDQKVYTLAVTLEDRGDGTLKKTVTLDSKDVTDVFVTFENGYHAAPTELTVSGNKTLEGKAEGEFDFYLYETDASFAVPQGSAALLQAKAVVRDSLGSFSFKLDYTEQDRGYHYYVLKEAVPADTLGISYDTTRYHITVNALDNGEGTMEARVMEVYCPYYEGEFDIRALSFTNRYEAEKTEYVLGGKKEYNLPLKDGMFTFRLSCSEGEIATAKNAADGTFTFPAVTLESAGEHVFFVTEAKGGSVEAGITYDFAKYKVTVPVFDNGAGKLVVDEANVKIEKDGSAASSVVFVNSYSASATEHVFFSGSKHLDGRALAAGEFTFELYAADSAYRKAELLDTAKNAADGTFRFEREMQFDRAGSYFFVIAEQRGALAGVTYDESVFGVKITVVDNGAGKLSVTSHEHVHLTAEGTATADVVSFFNTYTAKDASLTLSGTKTLEGKADGEFVLCLFESGEDFRLADTAAPIASETVAVKQSRGTYRFDLSYTAKDAGYHYYVIREAVPADTKGVTYDQSRFYVTVHVYDNGEGAVVADVVDILCSAKSGRFTPATLDFVNRYEAEKTEYVLGGKKEYNLPLKDGMFTFRLSSSEGEIATAKNAADGTFTFPAVTLESAGEHVFFISEVGGGNVQLGVTYDSAKYKVTVPVLDDGAGKLVVDEANVKIEKDGSAASSVVFVNRYSASATDVLHVSGAKHLIGRPLVSGEFAFELYAADQNYNKLQLLETTHNEKDGTFRFATELSFAREGAYYYVITEVAGDKEGVTYDESVFGVKITVVDEGAGKLVFSHEHFLIEEDGLLATEEVRFENVFTMDPPDRDPGDGEEEDPSGKEEIITPPEKAPQTGDDDCTLWFVLLSVTSIGVLSTFFCKKEKTEE